MQRPVPDPRSPQGVFHHETTGNGLTISTCMACGKKIASPTNCKLKLAEIAHRCFLIPRA